ncbi:MAG TPA: hypothetical protein VE993_15980 [Stellaceae bacterium]|nr:hypothetical protein [Stellaceae bacterium]
MVAVAPIVTAGAMMHPRNGLAAESAGQFMKSDNEHCLGVRFGRVQPNSELVVWDCGDARKNPDQDGWVFDTGRKKGVLKNGNLCVGAGGPPSNDGTPLVLAPCSTALQWKWLGPNGDRQSGQLVSNHGLCLDAVNGIHTEAVERKCGGPLSPFHKDQYWAFKNAGPAAMAPHPPGVAKRHAS